MFTRSGVPPVLFYKRGSIGDLIEAYRANLRQEISVYPRNDVLNTQEDDLVSYFESRFSIEPPALIEGEITVDQDEVSVPTQDVLGGRGAVTLVEYSYFVPFAGEGDVFEFRPNPFSLNPPRGEVKGQELILRFRDQPGQPTNIKSQFDALLLAIKGNLEALTKNLDEWNRSVGPLARQLIQARRKELLDQADRLTKLGYPLRRREGAPTTYSIPDVRRRVRIDRPKASKNSPPEPALAMSEYEEILTIMFNVGRAMELSPSAFRDLGEEDLRTHFLVQLNGQYEGQATGETFSLTGKTDICIRANDRNVFIAECKFWTGPKGLGEATDQLLDYVSWRDTKTAILVFNKERSLSTVLTRIPEVIRAHRCFVREIEYKLETGFRYVLHQRDDAERELILTVLVFEIPT